MGTMDKELTSESDATLRLDRRTVLKTVGAGLFATGLGTTASAQERFPPSERTHWGRPKGLGNGVVSTFLTLSQSDAPRFLGLWFTEDALDGLPEEQSKEEHGLTVPLPQTATNAVNIEWVTVGWNPEGHVPAGVYDVPHFDFHFFLVEQEEVEQEIPPGSCDTDDDGTADFGVSCDVQERGVEPLPDVQRPDGYVSTDETVPFMGNHWVNQNAPEFNGKRFTHTWIYGSYDGQLNFIEPMITREVLMNLRGREITDVPTPEAFPEAGFYPTQYVIRYLRRQDAYAVFLRRFRQFPGT